MGLFNLLFPIVALYSMMFTQCSATFSFLVVDSQAVLVSEFLLPQRSIVLLYGFFLWTVRELLWDIKSRMELLLHRA